MNPLLDAEHGTLFDEDSNILGRVRYRHDGTDITLIFSDKPEREIPDGILLMPDGKDYDFSTFFCNVVSHSYKEFHVETTDRTYYLLECTTPDDPSKGEELRVRVTFNIDIIFDDNHQSLPVIVKDVSASGLKFISTEELALGRTFSFIFTLSPTPVILTAKILRKRPSRDPDVHCYGCRFHMLPSSTENTVRKFVFTEDLIQRRKRREF